MMPHLFISLIVTAVSVTLALAEDETPFSTVPDATWERSEPLKEIELNLSGFDFSSQTCRITCGVPPLQVIQNIGAAAAPRANLYAPTEYLDAVASVDVVSWQPPLPGFTDGSFPSVFTRIQPETGFGKTDGFALSLRPLPNGQGRIRIYLAFNEGLLQLGESSTFTLDPTRIYRLVLASRGDSHTGRIFDLTNPSTPLANITLQNPNLLTDPGRCGFGAAMPFALPLDVTFDNFLAWDGTPPPLTIREGAAPSTIEILADTRRTMASALQTTTDLTNPASWLPAAPQSTAESGPNLVRIFSITGPQAFFRGKSL